MHGRPLLALVLLTALALACAGSGARRDAAASGLAVRRGTLRDRVLLTGELAAERSAELGAPRTREFELQIRWLAEDGAVVREGDRIVEFDNSRFSSEIEEKRLAAADAANQLALKGATGRTAASSRGFDVDKARTELEKARVAAAIPPDLLSTREYQERQLAVRRAEAELARAQADDATQGETAESDLAVQRIALEKARREIGTAESSIQALTLRAPRAGLVLIGEHPWEGRRLQVGDNVWAGMPVASLPDLSSLRVEADLSDVDDGKVRPGMRVACILDAYPDRTFAGTVAEISPVARESRRSPLLRSFPVLIRLDRPDPEHMRPGMSVRVEVAGAERAGALLVPRGAIDWSAPQPRARLASGGLAALRLGECSPSDCVLLSGLKEGTALRPAASGEGD